MKTTKIVLLIFGTFCFSAFGVAIKHAFDTEQGEKPFNQELLHSGEDLLNFENTEQAERIILEQIPEESSSSEQINEPKYVLTEPVATSNTNIYNLINEKSPSAGSSDKNVAVKQKGDTKEVKPRRKDHYTLIIDDDFIDVIENKKTQSTIEIREFKKWFKYEKKVFFKEIENIELQWQKDIVKDVHYFLTYLEERWLNYIGNIDSYVSKNFIKKSPSWDVKQWLIWMHTEGTDLLSYQFTEWFKYCHEELKSQTFDGFINWVVEKKEIIKSQYWPEYKKVKTLMKLLDFVDKMKKDLHNNVEDFYKPTYNQLLGKFIKWKNNFIMEWINLEIYNSWLKEIPK
ncbi:tryptophan-rich antigen, putative [Hepatocystis sp. ex Piliocolobus tephrosceles]|nr:tryptophan-rich antigen, putative [Hepatocystis sp. ex Piliocolobus tephrosceles]